MKVKLLKIKMFHPIGTSDMHMEFETEIPKQTHFEYVITSRPGLGGLVTDQLISVNIISGKVGE